MHPALEHTDHRPWPLPASPWRWRQRWHDLLFAHWRIDADRLRPLIPEPLQIDEIDGSAWLAVVPFRMSGVMPRGLPDIPGLHAFPECNVRTYVTHEGRPGVWFLSLDAANALAVWVARTFFHLPYFRARMACDHDGDDIRYASRRPHGGAAIVGRYGPTGPARRREPGSLEHALTERYALYAQGRGGRLNTTEVHHPPWPLQPAWAELHEETLRASHGLDDGRPPDLLHFARKLEVVVWNPRDLATPSGRGG